ncbi:hypothetical protein ABEW03_04590, partial [Virgibacillus pantothenticus]|uniref:hypothetical protein n=1 Tax=Virgibacillus pantothenticus TaxID=1473 RepID=UPI003D29CFF5
LVDSFQFATLLNGRLAFVLPHPKTNDPYFKHHILPVLTIITKYTIETSRLFCKNDFRAEAVKYIRELLSTFHFL